MLNVVPNYYGSFKCIAAACTHSCCVGWEIDIDADSYNRYMSMQGETGDRLRRNIAENDGQPYFVHCEGERCPMLNANGLCDLITTCGEDVLCDICADHPRFRNFFSDRTETGLGLCCEAAAELIINYPVPFSLVYTDDGEACDCLYVDEEEVLSLRDKAFAVVQNKNKRFDIRCKELLDEFGIAFADKKPSEWAAFYRQLERLDSSWDECLSYLEICNDMLFCADNEMQAENLLCSFLYRHIPAALDDGDFNSKISFAVHACSVIFTLSQKYKIEDVARMYSAEIEYSDENTDAVISALS